MTRYPLIPLMLFVASLAFAGGRNEEPQPEQPVPAMSAPASSAAQSGPEDSTVTEEDLVPMDEATAAALFQMGLMPFEQKIPSEDFRLPLLGGEESTLFDHRGKVVFLNFWATWCPPCREEMPSMQRLYDELASEGLEILAVNVLENEEAAQAFIDEQGFTYPVLLDVDGRVMTRYGVRAYPTTYLVDREGYVLGVRPGFHDWSTQEIIAAMRSLLAGP